MVARFPVRRCSRRGLLRGVAASVIVGVTPLLTACPVQRSPATVVRVDALGFVPGSLTVPLGTTVIWRNDTPDLRTVTCDPASAMPPGVMALPAGAPPWNSGDLAAGEMFTYTLTIPGTYVYASSRNPDERFIGSITVRP